MGSYTSAISGCAGYCGKPKTAAQTIDIDGPVRISIPNGKTDYTPKKVIEVLDEKYQKTSESKKKEKEKNKNNKKQEEDDEKGSKLRARSKTNLIEDNKLKDTSNPNDSTAVTERKRERSMTIYKLNVIKTGEQTINDKDVYVEKLNEKAVEEQKRNNRTKRFSTTINAKPFFAKTKEHDELEKMFASKMSEKGDFDKVLNEIEQDKGIIFKKLKNRVSNKNVRNVIPVATKKASNNNLVKQQE